MSDAAPHRLQRLDWALVQAFLAVLEHGSLARAAQATEQSQPTLGRQLAALEAALQASLFTRGPRGSVLTEAGEALAGPARQMQAAADALQRVASGQSQALAGSVRIGASEAVCAAFLAEALRPLRERHPEIQLDLVANDAHDDVLVREADIVLRMVRPEQGALVTRSLGVVPMGAFARRGYLAARGLSAPLANPADLARCDWIGQDKADHILRGMQRLNPGMRRERFAVRSDSEAVRWQALLQGLGVGFALDAQAAREPELLRVLPADWVPPLPLWLTAPQELRHSARIRCVFDHLARVLPPLLGAVHAPAAEGGPPAGASRSACAT